MADPLKPSKRRLLEKRKAFFVAQVIKETGKVDLTEARNRMYPNAAHDTNRAHAGEMLKGEHTMDYLEKMLHATDKDIAKKLKPEMIMQDLLEDLRVLNEARDSGQITTEDLVKILNAKAGKQKLLGMAIGMWRAELPPEKQESADELLSKLTLPKENS